MIPTSPLVSCQDMSTDLAWTIRYFDLDLGSQVGDSKMKGQLEFIPGSRKLSLVVVAAVFCRRAGCRLGKCLASKMFHYAVPITDSPVPSFLKGLQLPPQAGLFHLVTCITT